MKAIGFYAPHPIDHPESLVEAELPDPVAHGHDVLVEVRAVSVNPVDMKVRQRTQPAHGEMKILGYDAAGVVRSVGEHVTLFKPGDRIWYAGTLNRPGSNAELQLVDERIASLMPTRLDFAEAAALPLTSLTAWELLFDRLKVQEADPTAESRLLVVGAAGGVGSIVLQLARQLTGLTVIGTASRPETQAWCRDLGAHHVIDHHQPWLGQLEALGIHGVTHVIGLTHTGDYLNQIVEVLRPEGQLALIDDPKSFDILPFKQKSLSIHWELMFTRSMFHTPTLQRQHDILRRVAQLVDTGVLRTSLTERLSGITVANLKRGHSLVEQGVMRGKVVLERT